jgi:hypothetical protein
MTGRPELGAVFGALLSASSAGEVAKLRARPFEKGQIVFGGLLGALHEKMLPGGLGRATNLFYLIRLKS